MKKSIIYIAIIVIAIITAISLISLNNASPKYSMGMLNVSENTAFDFGVTNMQQGKVSHKFKLLNDGNETVDIEKVYTSCGCTTAYLIGDDGNRYGEFGMQGHGLKASANIEVEAKDSIILEAIFDPAAHGPEAIGKVKRFIYIETNSKTKPKIQLELSADVINEKVSNALPKAEANIMEYDFGEIFKKDGIVSADFIIGEITTSCGCTSAKTDKTEIPPQKNAVLTVYFDPNFHKEPESRFSRSIFVPTNDPNNKELEFKIFAELK